MRWNRLRVGTAISAYLVIAVGGLIVLRAKVVSLEFLGVGWILVLVLLPLLPGLLPQLPEFLREISPYVQSLKLGALQLDLRTIQRDPLRVPTDPKFASLPDDINALSTSTDIAELISALRQLRRKGGSPVVIIDLQVGRKWRLPNLYFLARLLEIEPVVSQLLFTEARGGTDSYFVGNCRPEELRRQMEQALPVFRDAAQNIRLSTELDLADPVQATQAADAFKAFRAALPEWSGAEDDPAQGYVTSDKVRAILGTKLSTVAIEVVSERLKEDDVDAILGSPHRFVPATAGGRVTELIDREAVALSVARSATART